MRRGCRRRALCDSPYLVDSDALRNVAPSAREVPYAADIAATDLKVTAVRSSLPLSESFRREYLMFYGILPLDIIGGRLRLAVAGGQCADAIEDMSSFYRVEIDLVDVTPAELESGVHAAFATQESVVELVRGLDGQTDGVHGTDVVSATDVRSEANQAPVVRFVNTLIREAHTAGASDIHLEATAQGLRVRLRIDGALSELPGPPPSLQHAVLSRLKLLGELDIAERQRPQDGRIRVRLGDRDLDLRVSTMPVIHGESVVIRLLERGGRPVGLDELGMPSSMLDAFRRMAAKPYGIVLTTGPTGSGKTTSLYAALTLRDAMLEKIVTVEDPVEYHLPGVAQVPVKVKSGVTFAAALRSILRQDPDVLMIGEMRDHETAAIAVQAAMTGHLVFSTLHTNDAISAIPRLIDLGVEPYLIAGSLEGVLAQRLVRRVCRKCQESYAPSPLAAAMLEHVGEEPIPLIRGRGCAACRETGYRGRVGLYEMLPVTDELKGEIIRGASLSVLRTVAREQGYRSLRDDGIAKVRAGITTIEEVVRVTGT